MKMQNKKILIVDDKITICQVLSEILEASGYKTAVAGSGEKGLEVFAREKPDFILTDLVMKGLSGVDFIREIRKDNPDIPIIILTAFGTISSAVEAMKAGADDYMTKPLNYDLLKLKISKILEEKERDREIITIKENLKEKWGLDNIIGASPVMEKMFKLIKAVSPTDSAVLIQGECGTGKELIARSIYTNSRRVGSPYVVVDCSAIPETLIESELFGYEKGAFSGADNRKNGRLEDADGGTLFLDEIGELPLSCQAKMLRVIQEHQFVRVGGNSEVEVDFRLIAATNKNLKSEVEKGNFRSDLFYRLNVINIESPPLRERKEDIPLLAETFMAQICRENGMAPKSIEREILSKMMSYDWPGNVRELKNSIQRLAILDSLPEEIDRFAAEPENSSSSLFDQERDLVEQALRKRNWNISKTAEDLGIGRKALYNRIKKYQLSEP